MKKLSLFSMFALALVFGIAGTALATPISTTINLDTVYVGYTPDGSAPWLMATFDQTGSNTGTLTLTSNLSASDFLQGLNSKKSTIGWAFYLDQSLASLTCSSGTCAGNNALFGGSYNAGPVPGTFNLAFGWSAGNRFVSGSTAAVYDLTFASVLNLDPFVANENGFASVAHVQGITGGCSGWIVSGDSSGANGSGPCDGTPPPHNVPEPADLGMFGIGLLAIGLFLGLRRRMA